MMLVKFKFIQNDHDNSGNPFPALHVQFEDGKCVKFITQDDYPRILGLRNETEIWDSELGEFKKMQLPFTYIQPYAAFLEDRMQIWCGFMPASMSDKADLEIPYSAVSGDWHEVEVPDMSIN